jgi:hypothetical protein
MGRKPPALARELLRNFPKRRARNARRRRKGAKGADGAVASEALGPGMDGSAAKAPDQVGVGEAEPAPAPERAPATEDAAGLAPAAENTLQRNVREALDHAGRESAPVSSDGE